MRKKLGMYLMVLSVCFTSGTISSVPATVSAAVREEGKESSGVIATMELASASESGKRGWVTYKNGQKKYFDKKGNYVTGFKTIEGKRYYFGPKGFLLPNRWVVVDGKTYRVGKDGYVLQGQLVTVKKKVYYLMNNGVMKTGWKIDDAGKMYFLEDGTRATGLTKVGERYYYFDSRGQMKTGTFTVGENTYYMSDSGVLEAWKSKTAHYDSKNNKMTSVQAEDFDTLQRAKAVVAQITTPSMTSEQKLRKCFDWVVSKYYATRRKFTNAEGWPAVYANDHFIYGSGNCQSDAAAFAYLAEALGYKNVYVCADSTGWGLPHSWAEINGLIYDPLFAEVKGYSRYYGSRYGSNTHSRPIVHIQLS